MANAVSYREDDGNVVWLHAVKELPPGSEVFWAYSEGDEDDEEGGGEEGASYVCKCGGEAVVYSMDIVPNLYFTHEQCPGNIR
jgi:hypothetical protein